VKKSRGLDREALVGIWLRLRCGNKEPHPLTGRRVTGGERGVN